MAQGQSWESHAGLGGHRQPITCQRPILSACQRDDLPGSSIPRRSPALPGLIGGHVALMFDQPPNSRPHVRSGKIKAYAVTAHKRLASAPEIPTVDEAGLPGFHISVWSAMWAPRGTPGPIISKLNSAVVDALTNPSVQRRLAGRRAGDPG